jgi:hypothetical protein
MMIDMALRVLHEKGTLFLLERSLQMDDFLPRHTADHLLQSFCNMCGSRSVVTVCGECRHLPW